MLLTVAAGCRHAGQCGGPTHPATNAVPDLRADDAPCNAIWLDSLGVVGIKQEWRKARARRSVDNHALRIGGKSYAHGIGTHATSQYAIELKGQATRFVANAGVDDETDGSGSVVFEVWVDGKRVAQTPVLRGEGAPALIDVPLDRAQRLELRVEAADFGITSDHADWAGALLYLVPGAKDTPPWNARANR